MSRMPVRTGVAVAALLAVPALGGCSGGDTPKFQGMKIANAEEILTEAETIFADETSDDVKDGTTTVSEDSRCYFHRMGEESVTEDVYCGPVRVLGEKKSAAWYPIPIETRVGADEEVYVSLDDDDADPLDAVDPAELIHPDGEEPVAIDDLKKPTAPEAPLDNFAALTESANLRISASFSKLKEPYRLITPAASLTITEKAELETIPQKVLQSVTPPDRDSEGPDLSSPFYRAADGQVAQAWKVTIGAPPDLAPPVSSNLFGDDDDARDASATLAVQAGAERLNVAGQLVDNTTVQAGKIPCTTVPCSNRDEKEYFLVVSGPEDAAPSLVSTVDGATQSVALGSGKLTSTVSTVAQKRSKTMVQTSTSWQTKQHLIRTEEQLEADDVDFVSGDLVYEYGGEVRRVYLSPFDYAKGWAPAGKAWLVVPIENDPARVTEGLYEASLDYGKTWTLRQGAKTVPSTVGAGKDDTAVFLVDDDFTKGTFVHQPSGSVKSSQVTAPFTAKEPLTLDINFPN